MWAAPQQPHADAGDLETWVLSLALSGLTLARPLMLQFLHVLKSLTTIDTQVTRILREMK